MQSLLLSLKPKFAAAIYSGEKRTEFRRVVPRCATPILAHIYETSPVCRLTGHVVVTDIFAAPINILLDRIDAGDPLLPAYRAYLTGARRPCALMLADAKRLDKPVTLERLLGPRCRPPQSYCYVDG